MNDLLSIACSRINVAITARHSSAYVPFSNLVVAFLNILTRLGYINNFKLIGISKILVLLKYSENKSVIRRLLRISTPGKRVFWRSDLKGAKFGNFQGFVILSTSSGLLIDQECKHHHIGGEPLVFVS